MAAIGYLRVSTNHQGKDGWSIEAQRKRVEGYAFLYDLELVEVIVEVGSAGSMKRPGLQKALTMLRDGDADSIIFAKLDRLTRSMVDLQVLMQSSQKESWALHSVAEKLDTSSASGRLVTSILGVVAQWEREVIAERTSEALKARQAKGLHVGAVPLGSRLNAEGALESDPEGQTQIEAVLALRSEGLSYRKIAAATGLKLGTVGNVIRRAKA